MASSNEDVDAAVQRVLAGDIDAYGEIIRTYQPSVWKVVSAMLLDLRESEDLVQQTFLRAYRHLHQFRRGQPFEAWFKQIARNEVRQHLRSRQRADQRLAVYHAHLLNAWDDPDAAAVEDRMTDALRACSGKLPLASARLIELRYEQAWEFGRIAEAVGRTVGATREQLARIRITLRDCIEKELAKP